MEGSETVNDRGRRMNREKTCPILAAAAILLLAAGRSQGAYDVRVDLKNASGQVKTNWPVILRVYAVLGRNLDPAAVNRAGFHVYDPSGREVPHAIEKIPPYDQPGNDEIVFVIARIEPGQVLRYRITNTSKNSEKAARIDMVNSSHNLIADGGFSGKATAAARPARQLAGRPAHFAGPAKLDTAGGHAAAGSLMLSADNATVTAGYARKVKLHKGSWYYFGAWSRTRNVSRFGYQAGGGGHFRLTSRDPATDKEVPAFEGQLTPQCSTREWLKVTFEGGVTGWGMDRYAARAAQAEAGLEFVLRQRKHYYMAEGATSGQWWLDDVVLMEQPEVDVRFDLAVAPLLEDGAFLFTRPAATYLGRLDDKGRVEHEWCVFPYAHEKLTRLDKCALRGQRVSYCVGIYHTRHIEDVVVRLAGAGLKGAGDSVLPVELIEYCPGYVGAGRGRYMKVVGSAGSANPVTLGGKKGVRYFFLTFHVPPDARVGRYTGKVEVRFGKDRLHRSVPLTLRVQDMVQPMPRDVFVGMIFQGSNPPFNDAGLTVYARSGFNCLTRFGGFLGYEKDEAGRWRVDLDELDGKMKWLKKYGLAGVCVFSDFDLGPKWNGGALLKRTRPKDFNQGQQSWSERLKTAEGAWKAQIKRIEEARKKHPEWPTLIYMTWDEPNLGGGRNGKPDPAMGWVNQVAPEALTTLDVQFDPLPVCMPWYRAPAFDDPANWAGPEVYRWVKGQGGGFGFCGSAREEGDSARYQPGMMMITTGARYFHAWHLGRPQKMARQMTYDKQSDRVLRAVSMINWADGMNDLKAHTLLKAAIAKGRRSSDPTKRAAVKAAEEYLRKVFSVWNGDHKPTWPNEAYLGNTSDWGYERFYDDWQERMLRHAAAIEGVKWVQ